MVEKPEFNDDELDEIYSILIFYAEELNIADTATMRKIGAYLRAKDLIQGNYYDP